LTNEDIPVRSFNQVFSLTRWWTVQSQELKRTLAASTPCRKRASSFFTFVDASAAKDQRKFEIPIFSCNQPVT
jgi:hypothetical protein